VIKRESEPGEPRGSWSSRLLARKLPEYRLQKEGSLTELFVMLFIFLVGLMMGVVVICSVLHMYG